MLTYSQVIILSLARNSGVGGEVRDETHQISVEAMRQLMKAEALEVADIPICIWLDSVSKIPSLDTHMANASTKSGRTIIARRLLRPA